MALAIAFASIAQNGKKEHHNGKDKAGKEMKHHKGHAAEKLNLTDAQKAQLKLQNEEFHEQMQQLKNANLTEEQKKERRKELMKNRHEQRKALLTPEQKEQAKKLKKEGKYKHNGKGKKHDDDRGQAKGKKFGNMQEELDLTDAQSDRLRIINENFRNEMQSLRSNQSMTQEQKQEQMRALQLKHKNDIRSLLTTEQQDKLKDRLKNRPNRRAVK